MNNLLSKTLLCGVIATSFVLINCQKAPNRPVKSGVDPLAKPQAAKMAACSDNMITSLNARKALKTEIEALVKEDKDKKAAANNAAGAGLSDGQKEELQTKINELAKKSSELYSLLRAGPQAKPTSTPPAAGAFDGCTEPDAKDPKKMIEHKIEMLQDEDRKLATVVSQITGKSNDIVDGINAGYADGKSVKINAELAAMLSSKNNVNGAKMIIDGKVLDGGAAYNSALADKTKTSCIAAQVDDAAVAADTSAKITSIGTPSRDQSSQRTTVLVALAVKGGDSDRAMALSCNIADNADVSQELTKALGALMPIQAQAPAAPAAPAPAPVSPAASGDGSAATPPPAAASGDGSAATPPPAAPASGDESETSQVFNLVNSRLSQ
jgi:hypothetical protein